MRAFGDAYRGKTVFLTGHTGFKGSWLATWLKMMGANVVGYSTAAPTNPSMFEVCGVEALVDRHLEADIRDSSRLEEAIRDARPDVLFHLAAQSLVRRSYADPIETLDVNVTGTAKVLDAVRVLGRRCAVVVVTSDKCYSNKNWVWGYRENDELGGADPYSMSKGAAELVVDSWRRSYFNKASGVRLASVRAGNVIGGGDWAEDRIVTDCVTALRAGKPIELRNPLATRPWQHVLEPLSGYLWLGKHLMASDGHRFAEPWNFGPTAASVRPVQSLVDTFISAWGDGDWAVLDSTQAPHEAIALGLNSDKAVHGLRWAPTWDFDQAVHATVAWYKAWLQGVDAARFSREQIEAYVESARGKALAWAVS